MLRVVICSIALILFHLPGVFAQVPAAKSAAPSNLPQAPAAAANPGNPAHRLERADLEAFSDGIFPIQFERSDIAGATGAERAAKAIRYAADNGARVINWSGF